MGKYYYLFLPQVFLAKNEVFEELLRERVNYYIEKNRPIDFWIIPSPLYFLESMTIVSSDNLSNYLAIISTNEEFILWIKLRIGFITSINRLTITENLEKKDLKLYGEIDLAFPTKVKILASSMPKYSTELLNSYHEYILKNLFSFSVRKNFV